MRPTTRILRTAAALLAVGIVAASVSASVVVPMTLAELSRNARVIADARVIGVHVTSDTGRLERVVSLRVMARWKGDADDVLHVRLPGGARGRTRTIVTGVPSMHVDDRFVLFLADAPDGAYRVLGLHQGAWRVTASPVDGAWLVGPVAPVQATPGPITRGDGTRLIRSLETFREIVRALVAQVP